MKKNGPDIVALILAVSLLLCLVMFAAGVIAGTFEKNSHVVLGENTTQVLMTIVGGIIALLGSYLGYRLGNGDEKKSKKHDEADTAIWPQRQGE